MPQVISCPKCSQKMQVPDGSAGKQVRCPACKTIFPVAAPAAAAARQPVGAAAGAPGPTPAAAAPARPTPPSRPSLPTPPPSSAPTGTPKECPACKSPLLEGAIACMDCGYLLQPEAGAGEGEGPPNLCSNPACGVANPPGERTW